MKKNGKGANMSAILAENTCEKSTFKRAVFSLFYAPVVSDDKLADRPDLVTVTREITFTYGLRRHVINDGNGMWGNVPPHFILTVKDSCLLTVLKDASTRNFHSWEDFVSRAHSNPFLKILYECSNLNEDMFAFAELNPRIVFNIAIDISKYIKKVGEYTSFMTGDAFDNNIVSPKAQKARAYIRARYNI